jgi:hypothetical protein
MSAMRDQLAPSAKVSHDEWRFVGLVIGIVLILTSLPYAFAALSTPPERYFMGFILNVSDHSQYLSWYKAFQTDYLISNRLTPEANPPIFFNLLWWALGRFGRYSGFNYIVVYQIFRWAAGAFFLVAVYGFSSLVFPSVARRRAAFLIIALGAGLGWALVVLKYTLARGELLFPLDLYVAEGNSFLCILAYPHFAEAAALILAVLGLLLVGQRQNRLRYALYAGLVALFLGWQHAYDLLIVWCVPAAYTGVRWLLDRQPPVYWVKALLIVGLLSFPPALYSVLLTRLDPTWKEVLAQFANAGVYSPTPLHMLILMGLPLILAIVTLAPLVRDRSRGGNPLPLQSSTDHGLFIGVWFVVGWALTYVPTDFQIHMINSWQVPIGLLATTGLFDYILPSIGRRWKIGQLVLPATLIFVVLSAMTNTYLWVWRFVDLNRHDYPYYLYRDEVAAMQWLEQYAPADSIVFSAYDTGGYLPGISGQRAFLGHWAQTVDFYGKTKLVGEFFDGSTTDAQRQRILQQYHVNYVLYGPAEQALGSYVPDDSAFLALVFSSPQAKVYAVNNPLQ